MLGLTTSTQAKTLSDIELLQRSQNQPWLFAELVDRYQAPFLRKAMSILHHEPDAEEVVQDAFVKIYQNADRFTPQAGAKFSSWAYRIVVNTACTRYQQNRRQHERTVLVAPELEALLPAGAEGQVVEEDKDAIRRVLDKLPEHFASVLRKHYLERWSQADIARETGEQIGTVKTRIHRAKAAFRRYGHTLK